ncbi:MAG: nitrous oxide reductase family maturation protein NosD [Deltaproteobacteria bacterium]|nr:nitrous oxide reductase family maturation protein NosD [Deltaproteobacteria bacterium]
MRARPRALRAAARALAGALLLPASVLLGPAQAGSSAERAGALQSFQTLVDATPDGGVLAPPPGTYAGPVVIRRPMRIDGAGRVTIDGGGRGTVVQIDASGVVLRGLHLTGSGANHDAVDAGVKIVGSRNVVEDNLIEDCLFGVDLAQSNENRVLRNRIHSKHLDMGVRGDAIRLWYSFRNEIAGNDISDVRDLVVWYSEGNVFRGNRVARARYALHTMYARKNVIEDDEYRDNMAGIFLMYSDGVEIRRTRILGSQGATGIGIGLKETSGVVAEDNWIVYCAQGVYLDVSPYEPDTTNRFLRNEIAYNGVGVTLHSDWHGNVFEENDFRGNFVQVAVRGGGSALRNTWAHNYWDDYEGFDRDADGTGDTPYELRAYADRIWMAVPEASLFRASPLLEVIDFLDRLAPFSNPTLILRDAAPRFDRRAEVRETRGPT